ncbi:DUF6497 family protein [Ostreiculturibacter nitratireducens]|uniref:DUF6497 family protein n=1 Tax=Ostreiculturibacter nitratireducens TaxID=3075226 RepID=UPI0031B5D007
MHRLGRSLAALTLASAPAHAEDLIEVPSGQAVTYVDTVNTAPGPEGFTIRFRFLAPAIARDGGTVSAEDALADMAFLCDTYALPRIANPGPQPEQVIISLSDRPVPFGEADPEATQFFEAFRPVDGICVWEAF